MNRLIVALLVCASASPALADQGVDAQIYKPALDPGGLFSLESSRGLEKWDFGLQIGVNFAQAPLRLSVENIASRDVLDSQLTLDLNVSFGVTDRLTFAFDVPLSRQPLGAAYGTDGLYRPVDPGDESAYQPGTGFYSVRPDQNVVPSETPPGDTRVGLKWSLLQGKLGAALQVVGYLPFGDEDVFAGGAGFTVEPKLVIDYTGASFYASLNAGARLREGTLVETRHVSMDGYIRNDPVTHEAIYQPLLFVGHEALVAAGARYSLASRIALGAEAYLLIPLAKDDTCTGACKNGDLAGDALLGLFVQATGEVVLSAGAGAGLLPDAARAETLRVLGSIAWSPSATGGRGGLSMGDRDHDGIADSIDICPEEAEDKDGFQDDDGCPELDNDLDGVLDAKDKCVNEPEDRDGYQDDDGCPDADDDGDGVPDLLDRCPQKAEDKDGFQDDDGCPDDDNDGDGILDKNDKCPNEPETVNGYQDEDGCPDEAAQGGPRLAADRIDLQGEAVEFAGGKSARLTAASLQTLDAIADVMKANPAVRIRVEVGVERSGARPRDRADDMRLTAERARAVQAYLSQKGVKPSQLDVAPLGSDRPLDAKNPKDPKVNRRVDFIRVTQ